MDATKVATNSKLISSYNAELSLVTVTIYSIRSCTVVKILCTILVIVLNAPPRLFLIKRSNRPKNQCDRKKLFDADVFE